LATLFEVSLLVGLHVLAVIAWIGAHFFEAAILHISLRKVPLKAKLEVYSKLLFRFNKITGLAAAFTLYIGVMLAADIQLGSLSYMFTTGWGILSTLFFIVLLIGLLAPVSPKTVGLLFNFALVSASAAGVAALASIALSLELGNVLSSNWGFAIISGALVAILLLIIGATQGLKRVQIGVLSSQALDGQGGEEVYKKIETLEKKMLRMVIPENIVALIVIALMVYAANPF